MNRCIACLPMFGDVVMDFKFMDYLLKALPLKGTMKHIRHQIHDTKHCYQQFLNNKGRRNQGNTADCKTQHPKIKTFDIKSNGKKQSVQSS